MVKVPTKVRYPPLGCSRRFGPSLETVSKQRRNALPINGDCSFVGLRSIQKIFPIGGSESHEAVFLGAIGSRVLQAALPIKARSRQMRIGREAYLSGQTLRSRSASNGGFVPSLHAGGRGCGDAFFLRIFQVATYHLSSKDVCGYINSRNG